MPVNDFSGEYRLTLDAKKRISIPAGIRKMLLPEAEGSLVFTRGLEGCVFIYPFDEWKRLTKEINTLNSFDIKVRNFIRLFVGSAHKVTIDGQGRILLPDSILQLGGIDKDIRLLGSLHKWEMWNPTVFEQYLEQNIPSLEVLAQDLNFSSMISSEGK